MRDSVTSKQNDDDEEEKSSFNTRADGASASSQSGVVVDSSTRADNSSASSQRGVGIAIIVKWREETPGDRGNNAPSQPSSEPTIDTSRDNELANLNKETMHEAINVTK